MAFQQAWAIDVANRIAFPTVQRPRRRILVLVFSLSKQKGVVIAGWFSASVLSIVANPAAESAEHNARDCVTLIYPHLDNQYYSRPRCKFRTDKRRNEL